MYFIGILIFMGLLIGTTQFSATLKAYIDFPSIVVILGFTIPILMASGLLGDFAKGFKVMGEKENSFTALELKRMLIANKLAITLILLSGIMGSIIGGIGILSRLENMQIGPSLAMAVLTFFYAIVFTVLLIPIQAKIKTILTTLE